MTSAIHEGMPTYLKVCWPSLKCRFTWRIGGDRWSYGLLSLVSDVLMARRLWRPAPMRNGRRAGGATVIAALIEQDLDAVTNDLTMPWSSGPVEGRMNHF